MNDAVEIPEGPPNSEGISEKNTKPSREVPAALWGQTAVRCLFLFGTAILLVITCVQGSMDHYPHFATLVPVILSLLGDPYELAVLVSHIRKKRILRRIPMPLVLLYECTMITSTITGSIISAREVKTTYIKSQVNSSQGTETTYTTIVVHGHPQPEKDGDVIFLPVALLIILSVTRLGMLFMAVIDTVRWAGAIRANRTLREDEIGMPTEI